MYRWYCRASSWAGLSAQPCLVVVGFVASLERFELEPPEVLRVEELPVPLVRSVGAAALPVPGQGQRCPARASPAGSDGLRLIVYDSWLCPP